MAEDTPRPLCACHGEPMLRNGRYTWKEGQDWRCAVERREKARRFHDSLEHVAWNRRLLQMRRACATHRHRTRDAR